MTPKDSRASSFSHLRLSCVWCQHQNVILCHSQFIECRTIITTIDFTGTPIVCSISIERRNGIEQQPRDTMNWIEMKRQTRQSNEIDHSEVWNYLKREIPFLTRTDPTEWPPRIILCFTRVLVQLPRLWLNDSPLYDWNILTKLNYWRCKGGKEWRFWILMKVRKNE